MGTTYTKPGYEPACKAFGPKLVTEQTAIKHGTATPEISLNLWRYQYIKRVIDLLLGSLMLVGSMFPGILIAALIILTSAGPVFYREERIGRNGRRFRIWKFRTMYSGPRRRNGAASYANSGAIVHWRTRKHLRDPRVTALGRVLRSWSLDELPQVINVLRGEMSLVGPRPIVHAEFGFYADSLPFYLAAVPGLSGLWQVSGRCNLEYEDRVALDAKYVATWSLRNDLSILLRTLPAVLSREGAY
ncbi:MAG: sugar transferase [Terracidiphilus sp.]|jgi:lipopolysaccharide/colanic/teichoic acid biosynthesis glycosyltransferase